MATTSVLPLAEIASPAAFGSTFSPRPVRLAVLARQPFAPDAFDQVILGCVNVIAEEMNPARVAALRLGMGEAMVAFTVQINCGSGMQSIDTGYRYIREGVSDLILAGGAEALSYAPALPAPRVLAPRYWPR